jgi:guanylate kinase
MKVPDNSVSMSCRGSILVVSGPSGAGKTSLCRSLLDRHPEIVGSVSCTTRPPRDGEKDGREYFFVDEALFEKMIGEGAFLEWAEVHGHRYGTLERNVKERNTCRDLLLEVDCRGAARIREKVSDAILVFIMPPSIHDLVVRIRNRGPVTEEDLLRRMETARSEIQRLESYDYLLINREFTQALGELQSIVVAERCRQGSRIDSWKDKWIQEISLLGSP